MPPRSTWCLNSPSQLLKKTIANVLSWADGTLHMTLRGWGFPGILLRHNADYLTSVIEVSFEMSLLSQAMLLREVVRPSNMIHTHPPRYEAQLWLLWS